VEWYRIVFEVIDMRSFSNLWYWIALAVLWSTTSHWVLGVPFDVIQRARRTGGQAAADVEALVAINTRRILAIIAPPPPRSLLVTTFVLTSMAILAFWYWVEFAQAMLFLMGPMVIVGWLSLLTAVKIEAGDNEGRGAVSPADAASPAGAGGRHDRDLRDLDVRHVPEPQHLDPELTDGGRPHPPGRRARRS
jgi:hypothetical protein